MHPTATSQLGGGFCVMSHELPPTLKIDEGINLKNRFHRARHHARSYMHATTAWGKCAKRWDGMRCQLTNAYGMK